MITVHAFNDLLAADKSCDSLPVKHMLQTGQQGFTSGTLLFATVSRMTLNPVQPVILSSRAYWVQGWEIPATEA